MLSAGTLLDGRYEILGPLGEGGMGAVYRAARPLLGDEVAVKVMRASFDAPSDGRQRFLRESRACAQLRHPNIVTILDFNVDPTGQPYLVMELLSGPSLREELELSGPMTPEAVAAILTPVASALQLAHDRGITHRDLKPANIVAHRFESGERVYKVIDFGLVSIKDASGEQHLTDPNMFMGTMAYAAPEQIRGDQVEPRSDLYTLGVIVYEMLTGRRPFDASNQLTLINETLTARPVEPGKRQPGVSPAIDAVVMRALSKDPAERFASVTEFAKAFAAAAGATPALPTAASSEATLLARYELGDLLGRGRLGSAVYLGTHRALGIKVAIRVLRRAEQPNWGPVRARFLIEARTLQVPHPNLLHVRDFGEDERMVFVVTDFINGPSLRDELQKEGTLPFARVRVLLEQMLDATAALNARGGYIVGVNPEMIRLTRDGRRDRLVMSTAGIASVQDVLATMKEQELRGEEANEQELPYVAPEVLLGRQLGPSADVFTAAVLAYQMMCETLPFKARSLPELIGQMLQRRPAEPVSLNPEVPPRASDALMKALAADPAARFADAHEFAAELGLEID
jgi:serine/threonine-protein kinase